MRRLPRTLEELKSYAILDAVTGCWLWPGRKTGFGYGSGSWDGKTVCVHLLALKLAGRPVPKGLVADHVKELGCRSRACFNPAHLEAVTQRENLMRAPTSVAAKHAAKTHCKNGHPFSGDNLIIIKKGWRECRACRLAKRARAWRRRNS